VLAIWIDAGGGLKSGLGNLPLIICAKLSAPSIIGGGAPSLIWWPRTPLHRRAAQALN
jgi:hypothetical protein